MLIRKIRMLRCRLPGGAELLLTEEEAITLGDWLLDRGLVSARQQRRLAFGDVALERAGPMLERRKEAKHAA